MFAKFLRDAQGNVAILFGLTFPVIAGAVAVAIDYSDGNNIRAGLQASADAAALAGALELDAKSTASVTAAKNAAAKFATAKAPNAQQRIEASLSSSMVTVELSTEKTLFFGGILKQATMPIGVRADAIRDRSPSPCMLALGPNEPIGINLIGSASVYAPKCLVQSNAASANSITMQGAAGMSAWKVCASGGTGKARSSPPPQQCKAAEDPYKDRSLKQINPRSPKLVTTALSTYSGPCDFTNKTVAAKEKGIVPLTPGVYCGGLTVQSADVVLAPGLYVMQDGPLHLQGNATLKGIGVSILLSGSNAVLDLQGSPSMTLEAMKTGSLAGIAIASDTPASPILTSTLQGSPDINVTGSIYLPTQRFEMQGSPLLNMAGDRDSLVALSFRLQGSPDIKIASDSRKMKTTGGGVRLVR